MHNDKSILLETINSAIKRHSRKSGSKRLSDQFTNKKNIDLLKKLELRIQLLEDQNDQLLFFIHFLYKNFPDLVRNILPKNGTAYEPGLNGHGKKLGAIVIDESSKETQPALTKREIEILNLLIKGLCAKEIATELFICETTAITHKKNLKEKFSAKNTVELVSKAINNLLGTNRIPFPFDISK